MDLNLNLDEAWSQATAKIGQWLEAFVQHLPNLVAALLVLLFFWTLARAARAVVKGVLDRATDHGPLKALVATMAYAGVLLTGVLLALGVLELDKTVTSILAGVGIIGLALGFAFQDTAENFISGVLLSVRRPFTDGDLVESGDWMGIVEEVNLRTTVLRTLTGQMVRIPNSDVYGNPLVNYSVTGSRRVDVACGVSYGDDLEEARRVALAALTDVPGRDEGRDPEVFWEAFGGSSINFVGRFWIPFRASNAEWLRARSDAIAAIKRAFDAEGVAIPFPITTLDFGDVGGRRLREEVPALGRRVGEEDPADGVPG